MRLPFTTEAPLPRNLDAAINALDKALAGDSPHGYVRAWTPVGQRFLFFLQGKAHSAGKLEGDDFVAASIGETVRALRDADHAVLHGTDVALLLCLAVPFRKAPSAQVPAHLVDPHMLLDSVRKTETDAVLVVRRGDARTVAFCRGGEPQALYTPPDEPFPGDGSIADRIVEYVFSDRPESATLDIYDQIRLPPADDAGRPLRSYLEADEAEALTTKTIVVKLGDRTVFQYPMTKAEVTVGRGLDTDLTLDNLSVSREHARIRRESERVLVVEDLGGKNGLVQRGQKVERAFLGAGDSVEIGKYTLVYRDAAPEQDAPMRRTGRDRMGAMQETMAVEPLSGLILRQGDKEHPLRMVLTIGKGEKANAQISGWFIAPQHVQIVRDEEGVFQALHLHGRRAMRVNGKKTKKAPLRVGDELRIGRNVFHVVRDDDD